MNNKNIKPLIFWEGFPACGLILKQVVNEFGANLKILATRSAVPFQDLENILEHEIIWLDDANDIWARRHQFSDRNLIIHSGWRYGNWLKYDKWIKNKNNAKIILSIDNKFYGSFRQYIGAIWFRLHLRRNFDSVLVSGRASAKLM